jgi:hypothetical protein
MPRVGGENFGQCGSLMEGKAQGRQHYYNKGPHKAKLIIGSIAILLLLKDFTQCYNNRRICFWV